MSRDRQELSAGERRDGRARPHGLALVALALTVVFPLSACATMSVRPGGSEQTTSPASATPTSTSSSPSESATTPTASSPSPTPDASLAAVTVTIASSGADGQDVFASGIVTGASSDEGTCVLEATSAGGESLTAERDAHATPGALNCGVLRIAAGPGDWNLVLSFRSATSAGSSAPTSVHQP